MPEYRVGYLARGIGNSCRLPFTVYDSDETQGGWGQDNIVRVWNDFSQGEFGIILTTDDLSRRGWFANPAMYGPLAQFLGDGRSFLKYAYTPIDSVGPDGARLGIEMRQAAAGYDKVLAASEWGASVLKNSGRPDADWLPHGLHSKFCIQENPRPLLGWAEEEVWTGVVMANQSRKDWPVAFECLAVLKAQYGNKFRAWLHIDRLVAYFNIYALAADYGVADILQITTELNDDQLALRYSACDCTILPSGGEGFSFPTAESMMCGTACVVTDYAAGQELVPEDCRVRPVTHRVDTQHNCRRAVNSGYAFANAAKEQIEKKRVDPEGRSEELASMVEHLQWDKLKIPWQRWFLAGLKNGNA